MLYLIKIEFKKGELLMLTTIVVISSIGFLVCVYGFFIKRNLKLDQGYKAVCDLSDKVSCTKTFLSPWGKLFGV